MEAPRECVYCGSTEDLTTEHAPPAGVFPKPRPNTLITVRACRACNAAGSKDAEYFRLCLCLNPQAKGSVSVQAVKPSVIRSLHREEATGFRQAFLSGLAFDAGKFSILIDGKRILSVVERTVQCLYAHEIGRRIPDTHEVLALNDDYLTQFEPNWVREFQRDFVQPLADLNPKVVCPDAFAYASIHTSVAFTSVWGLLFYRSMPFVALTALRKRPLKPRRGA